jgi:hypothetical protein
MICYLRRKYIFATLSFANFTKKSWFNLELSCISILSLNNDAPTIIYAKLGMNIISLLQAHLLFRALNTNMAVVQTSKLQATVGALSVMF